MLTRPALEVIGYRWIESGGAHACDLCRSLAGREFYYQPRPGQECVEDMPGPPAHPNCRCSAEPIIDPNICEAMAHREAVTGGEGRDDEVPQPVLSHTYKGERYGGGFALVWGEDGRDLADGPAYGYYGGQNRSRGCNVTGMSEAEIRRLPEPEPADLMDAAYKKHDKAYARANETTRTDDEKEELKNEADQELLADLRSLPENTDEWGRGNLSDNERKYASRYRSWAIFWFGNMRYPSYHKRGNGDDNDLW